MARAWQAVAGGAPAPDLSSASSALAAPGAARNLPIDEALGRARGLAEGLARAEAEGATPEHDPRFPRSGLRRRRAAQGATAVLGAWGFLERGESTRAR